MTVRSLIRPLLLSLAFIIPLKGFCQIFGNEWIDFNKEYFKINVKNDGIYRVTYSQLQNAGFPVESIDPRQLQLFFRGEELAIAVKGEEDGQFNSADYLEFYGLKNDGTLDAFMYNDPANHTNPYINYYSNTTAYFLTFTLDGSFGKRIPSLGTDNPGLSPEGYHLEETLMHFNNTFSQGRIYPTYFKSIGNGAFLSDFTEPKGYTDKVYGGTNKVNYTLAVSNLTTAGPKPVLRLRLAGWSNTPHDIDILVGPNTSSQRVLTKLTFENYEMKEYTAQLEFSDLASNQVVLSYQINQTTSDNERVAMASVQLTYPQQFNANNQTFKTFRLRNNPSGNSRVVINNVRNNSTLYDISDYSNIKIINSNFAGSTLTATIPGTASSRQLLLNASRRSANSIEAVDFNPIPTHNDYIIITHKDLMKPANGHDDVIEAYAEYRRAPEGGNHKVLIAEVTDLYNQFSYGETTPLAFRRFADYLLNQGNPEYLLLIGKGLDLTLQYENSRPESESWPFRSLVPCYGKPCSDNAITAGLNGTLHDPALATGRLSVNQPEQVIDYLNKVIEFENAPFDNLRRKHLLHISGGRTTAEHRKMRAFVDALKGIAEAEFVGGQVKTVSKTTSEAVEFIDVSDDINQGLLMVTFFGHSSTTATDIDIGKASDELLGYKNKGKYPMFLINGCNAGDIYAKNVSLGEDWTLTPEKGAILFSAHSDLGLDGSLFSYSSKIYSTLLADDVYLNYPVGKAFQETIKRYIALNPGNQLFWANAQQFVLQGDPAIRLFAATQPDYQIDDESLFIQPFNPEEAITVQTDSFQIGIVTSNFGKVSHNPMDITVRRIYENGTVKEYAPLIVQPPYYQDTLYFTVPRSAEDAIIGHGTNTFEVILDNNASIEELNENNNTGQIQLTLPRGAMNLITPQEFSIVSTQPVNLFAQNTDPYSEERYYTFQLDTTDSFNSPAFQETEVLASITPQWATHLLSDNDTDSLVYYARVRYRDLGPEDDTTWASTSFIYIKDSPSGWSQSHFPQFKKDEVNRIRRHEQSRTWAFIRDKIEIFAKTTGGAHDSPHTYSLDVNGVRVIDHGECSEGRLLIIPFDKDNGIIYNYPFNWYNTPLTCGSAVPGNPNNHRAATWQEENMLNSGWRTLRSIFRKIEQDDYVLVMTIGDFQMETLKSWNWEELVKIGIDTDQLQAKVKNGEPYIAFGKMGAPANSATEIFAQPENVSGTPPNEQVITGDFEIVLDNRQGTISSTIIGPAQAWGHSWAKFHDKDSEQDLVKVDLYGINLNGTETLLQEAVNLTHEDLSNINASEYPYLRLMADIEDLTQQTPMQLKDWKVFYEPMPEGMLFFAGKAPEQDPLPSFQEGDSIRYKFSFVNVSEVDFEKSLIVKYSLQNLETNKQEVLYDTLGTLKANQSLAFESAIPSIGFGGKNELNVQVNPRLQPEQIYENNVLKVNYKVSIDNTNPILDVLFDGRHILDGEIVSPSPLISITLKDENKHLIRKDTTGMELYMKTCDDCEFQRIYFATPQVTWLGSENNSFQVDYQPERLEDGIYTLMVQASDISGNKSGLKPYQTRFEVINESKITHFYPYPNPFSDKVRFVFTLTGNIIPDQIKIQILTVSGRVVREITQDELGPIKIGHNISEYAWDGRDEFGGQLANGPYFYRVITRANGNSIEHRETSADHMFKKGFGKLYLLR
ncbi:C25 family cysteine peptidase [Rapidithrix thailandica]|uniref:C25 family cysteine peptidase n=1 Tax=Rapidithrix thailandica TaxID=413964 RepID=A0AAW9SC91_9BACT